MQRTSVRTALLALGGIKTACVTAQHIPSTVALGAGAFFCTVGAPVHDLARSQAIMPSKGAMPWQWFMPCGKCKVSRPEKEQQWCTHVEPNQRNQRRSTVSSKNGWRTLGLVGLIYQRLGENGRKFTSKSVKSTWRTLKFRLVGPDAVLVKLSVSFDGQSLGYEMWMSPRMHRREVGNIMGK